MPAAEPTGDASDEEPGSEEEDEDDYVDDVPIVSKYQQKGDKAVRRSSVLAEPITLVSHSTLVKTPLANSDRYDAEPTDQADGRRNQNCAEEPGREAGHSRNFAALHVSFHYLHLIPCSNPITSLLPAPDSRGKALQAPGKVAAEHSCRRDGAKTVPGQRCHHQTRGQWRLFLCGGLGAH